MFAVIGLLVHGFLIVGAMTIIGTTLTLPGIAGIVLTIGMAVDANVLIYERIREELRNGKIRRSRPSSTASSAPSSRSSTATSRRSPPPSSCSGSARARSAGFAVTLTIGILTSVFTAVTVTRLLVVCGSGRQGQGPCRRSAGLRACHFEKSKGATMFFPVPNFKGFDFFPHNLRLPFMRLQGPLLWAARSSHGAIAAAVLHAWPQLRRRFQGWLADRGAVQKRPRRSARLREQAQRARRLGAVQIQSFGADTDVLIRIEQQPGGEPSSRWR